MKNNYLPKVKIFFTGLMTLWLVMVVFVTKNDVIERQVSFVDRGTSSLLYRAQFNQEHGGFNPLDGTSLMGVFKRPERVVASDTAVGIPVLVYHGLVATPDRFSTTPALFKEQMFALKRAGYETVTLADFIAFVKGEKSLPEKSFLLTFDDGRTDSFENADPVLQALGWSAVMFVATGQSLGDESESSYYLNERQLREMRESGRWEIESHAIQAGGGFIPIGPNGEEGNFLSNRMWLTAEGRFETEAEYRQRVTNELGLSRLTIHEKLGEIPRAFAYPFSDYGHQTVNAEGISEDAVREAVTANYEVAFRQTWDVDDYFTFNYMDEDLFRLRRIETPSLWNGEALLGYLARVEPKPLPYTDTLAQNRGWKNPWGSVSFGEGSGESNENGMRLSSNEISNGASAFLDGTRAWRDYHYTVRVGRDGNEYFTLYARYQSNDNYAACTFGPGLARIEEKVEGRNRTLVETPYSAPSLSVDYSIRVEGGRVECRERDALVAQASGLNPKISTGGIGLRVWSESGPLSVNFSELRAEPLDQSTAVSLTR